MVTLPLALRRRRAIDPRILIGVALVVASALGTTWLVSALTRSVVVYRADAAIVAGDRVTAARLAPTTVRLGDATGLYLTGTVPADGLVATRTIGRGEIVPRSAVATAASTASATVVVDLASPLAAGVAVGSTVDLWSAARKEEAGRAVFGPPVVLVGDAVVARVVAPTGLIARTADDAVELRIDRTDVAAVLAAQASGARLSVVAIGDAR
jgi:hypothetical protein